MPQDSYNSNLGSCCKARNGMGKWLRNTRISMFPLKDAKRKRIKHSSMVIFHQLYTFLCMYGEWELVSRAVSLLVHLVYIGMLLLTLASRHIYMCLRPSLASWRGWLHANSLLETVPGTSCLPRLAHQLFGGVLVNTSLKGAF